MRLLKLCRRAKRQTRAGVRAGPEHKQSRHGCDYRKPCLHADTPHRVTDRGYLEQRKREDLRRQGGTGSKTGGDQSEKGDEKRAHRDSTRISRRIGTSAFSARTAFSVTTTPVRSGKALNRNLIISPTGDIQRDLIPAPSIPVSRQIAHLDVGRVAIVGSLVTKTDARNCDGLACNRKNWTHGCYNGSRS